MGVRLAAFNLKQIANLTCTDELDLYSIGEKKVALFCCIPDADTSLNYLVGMIYSNLFQTLYYVADRKYHGKLPIPVHCIMDEWPNVALPDDFDKLLATMRSRAISCSIIIQNIAQMKALFKDSWESLIGNCDEFLYLGGNEKEGHKYVSELLGKETLDTNTYGQTKGRSGSYSVNFQQSGRELLTPDEVRLLDNRKAVLLVRGEHPILQKKQVLKSMKAVREAKRAAMHSVQTAKQSAKTAKATGRGLKAMAEAAAHAVKAAFAALMAGGGAVFVVLILIVGIIGGAAFLGNSQSSEALSAEVLAHTPAIQKYASEFGIPEYVPAIQAIMMQESGGRGTDPMQASECPYNTQYPNTPGAIQDADYSIKVGIQYYADCVREAGCQSPQDMDKLKLSWQGYNYGNGYISWALEKFGGYSEANALQFSQEQAAAHGWSGYGDPEYVPHVMRYYSGGGWFTGLFGNRQLVTIAKSQLGNEGGEKFWSWWGFTERQEWCACFVSWCADQAGLIQNGAVPKFSLCTAGVDWFQAQGKWQGAGSVPSPGMIIFFDWDHDGASDHVGIVESCDGTTVHTIEGNSGDAVRQNSYTVNSQSILGYGLVAY